MPRSLAYSLVDVFAEQPFAGNQLAIFHDGRSLSDAQMQTLARETNLSETTFILPADDPASEQDGVRVRIFTTEEELPFAGHPTLGTASWLWWHHPVLRGADTITLLLKAGAVRVRFTPPQPDEFGVHATMQQFDPVFGEQHDREAVAAVLGLSSADLDASHLPQTVSTGVPFCVVPLASLEVAERLQIPQRAAQHYLSAHGAKFFYCLAPAAERAAVDGPHWHARMQFYSGEDPATGSAAGCAISFLVRHGMAHSGHTVVLEQGIEISRPSRITTQATLDGNSVSKVFVGGRTIPVAQGSFFLPFGA